jgi:membrane fusion protein, heavy metal efflux system
LARRADIQTTPAQPLQSTHRIRIPGTVAPDQYRQVTVTPVVGGRITSVAGQLGDRVARGAPLAVMESSDFSDAQTNYIGMRAELAATDERMKRTVRLVEIGAASQQELEAIQAERTRLSAQVQGAASRLRLLGVSPERLRSVSAPSEVSGTLTIRAPIPGVVTARAVNAGQVVDTSVALFTIASLSPVWVIAEVPQRDLEGVKVGASALITADGRPDVALRGAVTYVAPELKSETRTAQVRVEVSTPRQQLLFGTFVNVEILGENTHGGVAVPAESVQTIGSRQFVYIAAGSQSGGYIEREVIVGTRADDLVEILRGVSAGDLIVSKGSFLVRAERERLGLRSEPSGAGTTTEEGRLVKIVVNDAAFQPARVEVGRNERLTLEFTRVSDKTCATEIVVPSQQIKKALPLNQPVAVEFRSTEPGEIGFSCGMAMLKGAVVVK